MFFFYCKLNYTFGGCRCQIFRACFSGKKAQLSPCFPFARFKPFVCTVQTRHLHGSNASFARFKPFVCTVQTGRLHGPNLRFSGFQCFFPYPGRLPEIFCCPDFSVCVCAGSSLRSRVRVASGAGACPFSEDPLPGLLVPYRPFTGSGRCLPGYGLSEVSAFAPDVLFVSVNILLWRCGRLCAPAEDLFPLPRCHPVVEPSFGIFYVFYGLLLYRQAEIVLEPC